MDLHPVGVLQEISGRELTLNARTNKNHARYKSFRPTPNRIESLLNVHRDSRAVTAHRVDVQAFILSLLLSLEQLSK